MKKLGSGKENDRYLRVYYEDLITGSDSISNILTFVGAQRPTHEIKPKTIKQRPSNSSDFSNPRELFFWHCIVAMLGEAFFMRMVRTRRYLRRFFLR